MTTKISESRYDDQRPLEKAKVCLRPYPSLFPDRSIALKKSKMRIRLASLLKKRNLFSPIFSLHFIYTWLFESVRNLASLRCRNSCVRSACWDSRDLEVHSSSSSSGHTYQRAFQRVLALFILKNPK